MRKKHGVVGGRWLLPASVLGLGFAACGGDFTDGGDVATNGGQVSGRAGNSGGGNTESGFDAGGRSGSGGRTRVEPPRTQAPSAGQGGTGGASSSSFAGETGEGGNFCGGCDEGQLRVVCADRTISEVVNFHGDPIDASVDNPCEVANQRYETERPTSPSDDSAGAGGAPSRPSICETYVAPGNVVLGTDGCVETEDTRRLGTCIIGGECCVMVSYEYCGP